MVTLQQVRASNALIAKNLPPRLVAVFVGATSGIGEYTLRAFVKSARSPRVYFVGRSREAGDKIKADCEALSDGGEFIFIQSDVSLLKNVDQVCRQIREQEKAINLLVLSQGTLVFNTETAEGLNYAAALVHHSRFRFIVNLLPLVQRATSLRRVVSIFAGTKEGNLDVNDIQGRKLPLIAKRGHGTSLMTLCLEALAEKAPEVSFIHVFPGFVKTGITRGTTGPIMAVFKAISSITALFLSMNEDECGERHLFLCTSARYASRSAGREDGIEVTDGVQVASGTDGEGGSGVYSVGEHGESAGPRVVDLLAQMRKDGVVDKVWDLTVQDFRKITGSEAIPA